ncbi:type 1 fimbrial protein [Variovorax sp. ZS18.2.2]|uniref:fimbrial protein n=1 Tax=Variovorax sp. ZS18.2.2 TaxID=2971255 RepID=UPI002150B99A|nr:fimbrial protein [Variovorax sp. ZS18.2.2]MCR6480128.1 type 1 fimbrial protein [Variovorax sp. ZS18.2.2]
MNPSNTSSMVKVKALAWKMRSVAPLVWGMGLLFTVSGVEAACFKPDNYQMKEILMDMGRVIIPNETPVGAVFKTERFPILINGASEVSSNCFGGGSVSGRILQGNPVPGRDNVFTTQVPGVGIRFSREITSGDGRSTQTFYPHNLARIGDVDTAIYSPSYFTVDLMKIAATTGNGPLAAGTYTTYTRDGDSSVIINSFLSGFGITIITPSCSVDAGSKNIVVDFGKVPQSNFKGRGTTTGDRNFNIRLNCRAGVGERNIVHLRMDATKDPAAVGDDGVLQITQGGANNATGVGIQIVDGNSRTPVKFGDEALVGPSKDGDYVLPYTARYFQTGEKVTPGRADGTATFTLDYK